MRIAVGGIHTESSTYNPVFTRAADFAVLRGAALLASPAFAPLGGFPHDFQPLLHARALPGGRVEAGAYAALKAEFLQRLAAAGPCDGVYLAMHGAMFVDGLLDAEGDWIAAVREAVGPGAPIAVSYDLHGNVGPRILDAIDIFAAYRTAPHVDVADTQRRAVAMLERMLREGSRPFVTMVRVPVLLPGERTSTVDEPARSLYARLPAIDRRPGVWDANILVGYVWADEPRAAAAAVVTATDPAAADAAAIELAGAYFAARDDFAFGPWTGTIDECLDRAERAATGPVILADSGDNPTGGGVGDRPDVLAALLARGFEGALVAGIADGPATEACYAAGPGARLDLCVGASLDAVNASPVRVEATVVFLEPADDTAERRAVVAVGGVTLVLTARRRPFHHLADFTALGLDPAKVRLLVVKSGYLSPNLAPLARPGLMALSPGAVPQDIPRLPARRVARPCFPFDEDFAFAPAPLRSARFKLQEPAA